LTEAAKPQWRPWFIDCRPAALPPAFVPDAKVIVYCEAEPGAGYNCATPILFTNARYAKVQGWVEQLRQQEGDRVLLQIHHHLRGSLELAPSRPLVLFGQVNSIAPPSSYRIARTTPPSTRTAAPVVPEAR
jgi:hypothetical protein